MFLTVNKDQQPEFKLRLTDVEGTLLNQANVWCRLLANKVRCWPGMGSKDLRMAYGGTAASGGLLIAACTS
eukprot:142850-Amphidinium_carterae.1